MPETVTYLDNIDVIKVESSGETTINDWENSMAQVTKIREETKCSQVLVDARQQNKSPDTMELYEFGSSLPSEYQFAVIISDNTLNDHYFLESVARNRGKTVQLFKTFKEALGWLKTSTYI